MEAVSKTSKNTIINFPQPIHEVLKLAQETVVAQGQQIQNLASQMGEDFTNAVQAIFDCKGRVIISGMGKSGIIGTKIAATLASTGTPAFFVHPGEAYHGDLGMIRGKDIILLIANSGETDEVLKLLPSLKSFGNKVISMTGNVNSTLAKHSDITLSVAVEREVCPNNLAPTTSTTATLVLGDALAIGLIHLRGFQPQDFARYHPGGSLGRRLLTKIKDVMIKENLPLVVENDTMKHVIMVMTKSHLGVAIVRDGKALLGVITDGDLRRALATGVNLNELTAKQVMSQSAVTINEEAKLDEGENLMREVHIKQVIAINDDGDITGILDFFQ